MRNNCSNFLKMKHDISKKTLLILLCCLVANMLWAQLAAPQFRCVTKRFNGDIDLTWQAPGVVGCGTLVGYRVYASLGSRTGPYAQLTAINSATTFTYTHTGANGNNSTWYYYMEAEAGCAQPSLPSDTLDNLPPNPPDFKFVTIQNGQTKMEWERGSDPETHAYVVYNTDTNQPLDTIFGRNNTRFTDLTAPPNTVRSYTLVAMDSCYNSGIVNVRPHHTILLAAATNRCGQSIKLTWNKYDNWRNNVEQYEIWVSKNGAPFTPSDTLMNSDTTYNFKDFLDGEALCFEVRGVENTTHYTSVSNAVCITGSIVQPTAYIYLKNATVNPDNTVGLSWVWNDNIDLKNYGINSSSDNTQYQRFSVLGAQFPLQNDNTTDAAFQAIDKQKTFYKIETIDSCDISFFSNYASTIHLKATAKENYENLLEWTAYDNPLGTLLNYEVYRINPTTLQEKKIANVPKNTTVFKNIANANEQVEQDVCYYVIAAARITLPGGTIEQVRSRSNKACAHQEVQLFVPNAFAPDGNNTEFKPLATFNATAQYYMAIYDRWGGIIFETSNIQTGWNGTKNGQALPQGAYTYYIRAQEPAGKPIERRGSLVLIR
jgi:gliding motility-associated-like protein